MEKKSIRLTVVEPVQNPVVVFPSFWSKQRQLEWVEKAKLQIVYHDTMTGSAEVAICAN